MTLFEARIRSENFDIPVKSIDPINVNFKKEK